MRRLAGGRAWSRSAVYAIWLGLSEVRSRLRLKRLAEQASPPCRGAPWSGGSAWRPAGRLERALQARAAGAARAGEDSTADDEASDRGRAEETLRESEERYSLAVSGANDGMWEWNLNTGAAYFSPRWKSMLGYADAEIGDAHRRMAQSHPPRRPRAGARRAAARTSTDDTPRFEYEHRLRHKDGSWRWVLARAAAVRHASGRAYRLVGLNSDISARKQVQQVLLELADGMDGLRREEAFGAAGAEVRDCPQCTREAFLCRVLRLSRHAGAHAGLLVPGQFAPCEEFDLAGTPCQEVIRMADR